MPTKKDGKSIDEIKKCASSASIKKSINELSAATGMQFKASGKRADFQKAVASMTQGQRAALKDVAQRAFRLGVRRGAMQALDAVLDREITVHGKGKDRHLLTERKRLKLGTRKLSLHGADVKGEDLTLSVPKHGVSTAKLGFKWPKAGRKAASKAG